MLLATVRIPDGSRSIYDVPMERVAIVAGARTPFVRSGKAFAQLGPLELAKHVVRGLIERHRVDAERVESLAFGVVVPERGKPNLAREIVLESAVDFHRVSLEENYEQVLTRFLVGRTRGRG